MLAVVPMAVGVAMGHPLQGSLYWALGVMSGEDDEEEETAQSETIITDKNGNEIRVVGDVDEALLEKLKMERHFQMKKHLIANNRNQLNQNRYQTPVQHQDQTNNLKRVSLFTKLQEKGKLILTEIWVYCTKSSQTVARIIVGGIFSLLILGLLAMMLRKTDYGGMILSIAFTCFYVFDAVIDSTWTSRIDAAIAYVYFLLLFTWACLGIECGCTHLFGIWMVQKKLGYERNIWCGTSSCIGNFCTYGIDTNTSNNRCFGAKRVNHLSYEYHTGK